jgi:preprotein translocase subunit SecG
MRRILEVFALSGAVYVCYDNAKGNGPFLVKMMWLLATIWEILTLCLAVWIAAKHFRELQRESAGWAVKNCLTVLVKSHTFYFARWACN